MAAFKCKMCGGSLEIVEGMTVCECEYCGTKQTLPKTDNEQNLNMINRANHFRQQCEFDKAMEIYERLLNNSEGDSEIYWSIVLCRYGIEYVDDPLTQKKIPTCHRTQFKSILDDADYIEAISHADVLQKEVYQKEAEYIDGIQKGILEISNKEEPFDIFICYKETDESGKRTPDSVLAQELYYQLTREGFKVFFSRITLEDKLGTAYEPYIFAALNSSKVMVVVGTKVEHFNAVWVRNEWSRFLMLMQNDRSKTLIPAYKDIDPYDLPDALSMFQAQDMSKLGFMQDLIRGVEKIVKYEPRQTVVKETVVKPASTTNSNIENLIKRGLLSLEDRKWKEADNFFELVLNEDVEESRAYFGKLMAELKATCEEDLKICEVDFSYSDNFKKAIRFGDDSLKEKLEFYKNQSIYNLAVSKMNAAKTAQEYKEAATIFLSIDGFSDSAQMAEKCVQDGIYQINCNSMNFAESEKQWLELAENFEKIIDYKDSEAKRRICLENADLAHKKSIYTSASNLQSLDTKENLEKAIGLYNNIKDYRDSEARIEECKAKIETIDRSEANRQQESIKYDRRGRNVCQYCGGAFKGVLLKHCSYCGKAKDY